MSTSNTPILDRLAPLPQPANPGPSPRVVLVGSLALGIAIAATVLLSGAPDPETCRRSIEAHYDAMFAGKSTVARVLTIALSIVAVIPVAITIHEIGHMLGGLLAGFRFHSLRLGPLHIARPLRISLQRISGTGYAGWASMVPVGRNRLRQRAMVLVFGGPAMSLLSGAAVLLLPAPRGFFAELYMIISVALGLRELVPFRRRIALSDGRRLLLLFCNRKWSERWLAMLELGSELEDGVLPEALSSDCLAEAVAYQDESLDTVGAHALAYAAAFHRHEDDEAARLLETCLRTSGWATPVQREALTSEAAVFQARRRKRVDLAEEWLALLPQPARSAWMRSRAEAAILEARGDDAGALEKLSEVERAFESLPDRTQRKMALRLLERWKSDLRRPGVRSGI